MRFSVAQIEELGFGPVLRETRGTRCRAGRILRRAAALLFRAAGHGHQHAKFVLLVSGSEEFRRQIDYPAAGPGLWQLDGVVSRKKQLLPYLLQRLQETHIRAGSGRELSGCRAFRG